MTIVIEFVSSRSQHAARLRLRWRRVTTVITVGYKSGILSQTQRRCWYPNHQQRARCNNLQPFHGGQKYSVLGAKFKQMCGIFRDKK